MGEQELNKKGVTILGKQVSVNTSAGRRVPDFLIDNNGVLGAIEVKFGNGVRSVMQTTKDRLIEFEGGSIVGKNAPKELRGETRLIPTEVWPVLDSKKTN